MSRRLPIHPQPLPEEALSSWIWRLAETYDMTVDEFTECALGITALDLRLLDYWPPGILIERLAERTGVALKRIRDMTLATYVPFLLDGLSSRPGLYSDYCCQFGVFEDPAQRVRSAAGERWLPWLSGDLAHAKLVGCVDCLGADRVRFGRLRWRASWMSSCPEHGISLQPVSLSEDFGRPPAMSVQDELVELDGWTMQAVTEGRVQLPGERVVHGGVWLRILRGVIDEICRPRRIDDPIRPAIEAAWKAAGVPYPRNQRRRGIFEKLDRLARMNVLQVAAFAMQPLINAGLHSMTTFSLRVAASVPLALDMEAIPAELEKIAALAQGNVDVAIDLRRMLNHRPRNARFVARTDETLKSLGIPILAPLLVASRGAYPY